MFRIMSKSASAAELLIYGPVGPVYWGDEVSAIDFAKLLKEVGNVSELSVRINSPGGDVFDGVAIYRQLVEHPAKVNISVDALAASAASFIAMAGDHITMAEAGAMMIHDAWSLAIGNAEEMRRTANLLDVTSQTIAEVYAARTGKSPTETRDAMRAETWYTAQQALDFGLIQEVAKNKTADDVQNVVGAKIYSLDDERYRFRNTPANLKPGRTAAAAFLSRQLVAITRSDLAARKTH